ncbi:unnamed protein product [Caenorhabditis auriculariae]|uniref:Chromo domain-containing protein n=1 Tax=Caenorhabditis auriculariae TaxID=2777116 RepID=A0A8S1GQQ1_9PELO|nr:unnamed protein product [Caenorhabditis auriculariae]
MSRRAAADDEYNVEKILKKRYIGNPKRLQYLIKWEGYDKPEDNTWTDAQDCECPEKVEEFEKTLGPAGNVEKRLSLVRKIKNLPTSSSRPKRAASLPDSDSTPRKKLAASAEKTGSSSRSQKKDRFTISMVDSNLEDSFNSVVSPVHSYKRASSSSTPKKYRFENGSKVREVAEIRNTPSGLVAKVIYEGRRGDANNSELVSVERLRKDYGELLLDYFIKKLRQASQLR